MDKGVRQLETEKEVIQSFLITTARYDFNRYEKRILNLIVNALQPNLEGEQLKGKITPNLFGETEVTFSMKELCVGDDTNRTQYYTALERLVEKTIRYEDEDRLRKCSIIQDLDIKKRSGSIHFTIAKTMMSVFLNFTKGYSKYILNISLSLRCVSSARLYELISNQPQPLTYRIDRLKEILGVEHYKLNGSFIQRVLIPAKKELDEVANWSFDFKPIRTGRKYTHIELIPINYPEREPQEIQKSNAIRKVHLSWFVDTDVSLKLMDLGFTKKQIDKHKETIRDFSYKYAHHTIEKIVEIWVRANRLKKDNPKGYLIKAMQDEVTEI